MESSVIALQFQEHYVSILCQSTSRAHIQKLLDGQYSTLAKVEALVASGDITLVGEPPRVTHDNRTFPANQTKAIAHETPKALVEYCLAVEAGCLYTFEEGAWEEIPLTVVRDEDGHYAA